MQGRFFFMAGFLCLAACGGGGGYTRSPVITPQVLDCGAAGLASVKVWSPAEADMTFRGRTYNLSRDDQKSGAYYKGQGMEYANRGVYGVIKVNGQTHQCDVRPRDLEPDAPEVSYPGNAAPGPVVQ